MKRIMLASALCAVICSATIAGAQEESALIKQLYNGGWPDKDTVAQLNKERLYQRGIEAYMMTLPGAERDRDAGRLRGEVRQGLQRSAGLEGSHERQDAGADAQL